MAHRLVILICMITVNLLSQFVRCLLKEPSYIISGCGIVFDSDADSEVEETAVKFNPMMKALGVDDYE